jgi:DNA-binding LacI/PurR family transcriptional regulator
MVTLVESGWAESLPGRGVVAARGFRKVTSGRVAFIDSDSHVSQMLYESMREAFRSCGLEPIYLGQRTGYPMEDALRMALEDDYAAALIWSYEGFPESLLVSKVTRQIPVVALDHRLEGAECDLITFDYETASFEATVHLIQQGCRRIGVTGMIDMLEITHARFRGYLRAMFAHGLQPKPCDFLFVATSGHNDPDVTLLETRLRSGDRPDGLLILQDSYGGPTVAAAIRSGLSLPSDLKLVTIGNDYDVQVDGLSMTAVALDWVDFSQKAFALLEARLDNLHGQPRTLYANHKLVIQGLSGAPRKNWTETIESANCLLVSRPSMHFNSRWRVQVTE